MPHSTITSTSSAEIIPLNPATPPESDAEAAAEVAIMLELWLVAAGLDMKLRTREFRAATAILPFINRRKRHTYVGQGKLRRLGHSDSLLKRGIAGLKRHGYLRVEHRMRSDNEADTNNMYPSIPPHAEPRVHAAMQELPMWKDEKQRRAGKRALTFLLNSYRADDPKSAPTLGSDAGPHPGFRRGANKPPFLTSDLTSVLTGATDVAPSHNKPDKKVGEEERKGGGREEGQTVTSSHNPYEARTRQRCYEVAGVEGDAVPVRPRGYRPLQFMASSL
jgi:hypothetical protein